MSWVRCCRCQRVVSDREEYCPFCFKPTSRSPHLHVPGSSPEPATTAGPTAGEPAPAGSFGRWCDDLVKQVRGRGLVASLAARAKR